MKTAAAKEKKLIRLAAALVLSLLAIAPAVDASRYIPTSLDPPLEPQLSALELLAEYEPPEPSPFELLGFEEHLVFTLGIFLDEAELEALNAARSLRPLTSDRPLENALRGVWAEKLASGVKSSESTTISLELKPLNLELHRGHQMAHLDGRFPGGQNLLFQGLWTDPVTGLSYARNRWYDARNASWLSEDPKGAVDSTNLYAGFAWNPSMFSDPMGSVIRKDNLWDPNTLLYKREGNWYQVNKDKIVYQIDINDSARHTRVDDSAVSNAVRQQAGIDTSIVENPALNKLVNTVAEQADYDTTMTVAYVYWAACATPALIGTSPIEGTLMYAPNKIALAAGVTGMTSSAAAARAGGGDTNQVLQSAAFGYGLGALGGRIDLNLVRGGTPAADVLNILKLGTAGYFGNWMGQKVSGEFDQGRANVAALGGGFSSVAVGLNPYVFVGVTGAMQLISDSLYEKMKHDEEQEAIEGNTQVPEQPVPDQTEPPSTDRGIEPD